MVLLMLFALIAGAGTALSPCVLPVLPAVLSAGVTGGRRRPLGVVAGLVLSFTFATVALVYVIAALGLPDDLVRWIAIVTIGVFGIVLLLPPLADRLEAAISRLAPGPARVRGDGFGSGFVLGLSLGLVYAPCAGPILGGVVIASASQDFTAGKLAVAFAYALGSGAVLYALMLGGRRISERLRPRQGQIQIAMGAVMVLVAVAMSASLDTRFQTAIASDLPSFLVNPTGGIEKSDEISGALASVRGNDGGFPAVSQDAGEKAAAVGEQLPNAGPAPDFAKTGEWFNTPGGRALSIKQLTDSGHVVLLDFWTYTCINCIRTLPYLKSWDQKYRKDGLVIVGVHTPEFPFEREASNVADAIHQNGLRYAVVQDNDYGTWDAYGNQYWPAEYLIDARGHVRHVQFGEGDYSGTENAIRTLLAEAGASRLGSMTKVHGQTPPKLATPETYVGMSRALGFVVPLVPGEHTYAAPEGLRTNQFALGGTWTETGEKGTSGAGASIDLNFVGQRVFVVLGTPDGKARRVRVLLNGKPQGTIVVNGQRLYDVVDLGSPGAGRLSLRFDPGISAYAFTFG